VGETDQVVLYAVSAAAQFGAVTLVVVERLHDRSRWADYQREPSASDLTVRPGFSEHPADTLHRAQHGVTTTEAALIASQVRDMLQFHPWRVWLPVGLLALGLITGTIAVLL
jgi:hypothetical protein